MGAVERLKALLPPGAAALLRREASPLGRREASPLGDGCGDGVTQVRLRIGRPVQVCTYRGGEELSDEPLERATLEGILAALMEYSVYARQEELNRGFFTLDDGSRVGVCGRMVGDGTRFRMDGIGSVCLRVARPVAGCASGLLAHIAPPGGVLRSTLLLSPPGLGKTTMLRDIARQLSDGGLCVAVADERHELAACHMGVPTLDVGLRTDVMDGCPRDRAIAQMLRAMAPQVVVADEIGGAEDALALADAARCGAAIMASAHAASLGEAQSRPNLRSVLEAGVVTLVALLGPVPGMVREVWRREDGEGVAAWRRA